MLPVHPTARCLTLQLQFPLNYIHCMQNIDRLHQAAGSTSIIELHGSLWDVCYPDKSASHHAISSCLYSHCKVTCDSTCKQNVPTEGATLVAVLSTLCYMLT